MLQYRLIYSLTQFLNHFVKFKFWLPTLFSGRSWVYAVTSALFSGWFSLTKSDKSKSKQDTHLSLFYGKITTKIFFSLFKKHQLINCYLFGYHKQRYPQRPQCRSWTRTWLCTNILSCPCFLSNGKLPLKDMAILLANENQGVSPASQ